MCIKKETVTQRAHALLLDFFAGGLHCNSDVYIVQQQRLHGPPKFQYRRLRLIKNHEGNCRGS